VQDNFHFSKAQPSDELVRSAVSVFRRWRSPIEMACTALCGRSEGEELGLKLIVGSQVSVADGSTIVLLAQDRDGYANLCRLLTKGRLRSEKGESAVSWEEVSRHASGLIAVWGGEHSLIVGEAAPDQVAGKLRDAFGDRLYGLLTRHRREEEVAQEARLRECAKRYGFPLVAANEVLYHSPARRRLQDILTAIRHGVPVASCGRKLKPNAEHDLKAPYAFARLFADDPAAFERTLEIAERCNFSLKEIRYRYPSENLPDGTTSAAWLRRLTFEGAHWRYGEEIPNNVVGQLEKELEIIGLDYPGYFLTMGDRRVCRANGILCQGAARRIPPFAIASGVTSVDPVRMGLLERFYLARRAEPPDIDLTSSMTGAKK
jgi:error-prone DNA polymerase